MKFFDLKDYYIANFNLLNSGNWTLQDLNEMMFWEREIYVNLLAEFNKKNKAKSSDSIENYYG